MFSFFLLFCSLLLILSIQFDERVANVKGIFTAILIILIDENEGKKKLLSDYT